MKTMKIYVLCNNDNPHSVFEDVAEAGKECKRLNHEDEKRCQDAHSASLVRRIYYHVHTVPLVKKTPGALDSTKNFTTRLAEATDQLRVLAADIGHEKLVIILANLAVEEVEREAADKEKQR